jgi:chromate reductase, NAD(P)H dehydrogenase (quinone)
MEILAISGSLRAASSNSALLRAAVALAPAGVTITVYGGLGSLPLFTPDLDDEGALLPPTVAELRRLVGAADGLLIASPEYAHGVPGALKNGLDWLVSSVDFAGKPVALLKTRPRSTHAYAALAETLVTMSATLITDPTLAIPLTNNQIDQAAIIANEVLSTRLRVAITTFAHAIEQHATSPSVIAVSWAEGICSTGTPRPVYTTPSGDRTQAR